ncbi:UNVERIFIED_CONTAM: putative sugar phosphate/phosphate translocator [Sesamum angustifolium]|uniref:Sugar phosphate/phosphate translocator n=1 Tax=Sesamum angustifolium TaxID=2727405 RepID=A0AAW2PFD6_9LAMI
MADRNRRWAKEEFLTYAYILLYIALSSGQIFFNKWVLSSKEINFPYPLGLTLLHMVFSSVLCFMLTKVLKIMKIDEGMTLDVYITSVIPIGAMFAMTLWLGNTAYLYISVAFAQMLKAIMPVAVFILGVLAGLEVMSYRMLLIMSVISFGVLVASYGEMEISWIGVVYQMGGVVGEALRLIFMEILVKRKGLKLNPISLMYYVSPCRHCSCLLIPWIFLEKPKMDEQGTWSFKPLCFDDSCGWGCQGLGCGSIFSSSFADTKLTLINLFGYAIEVQLTHYFAGGLTTIVDFALDKCIKFAWIFNKSITQQFDEQILNATAAIAGVAAYNNHKLRKEAYRVSPEEPAQSVPLVAASTSTNETRI